MSDRKGDKMSGIDIISYKLGQKSAGGGAGGGSGGNSSELRYVTFMSHDGTVQLGKKAVAVGDDCADPIARGIFDTPTKESTAQYNYSFVGWATTPNGAWDEAALDAVTEDRTVYAAYAAAVRYYTITFYDDDGATVLKTQQLAYGAMPSYTPTKENYLFVEWSPELTTVTGNAIYTAVWEEKVVFSSASWEKISAITTAGTSANTFAVGDTRRETLTYSDGTTEEIELVIAKIRTDGTMVLALNHALATLKPMHGSATGAQSIWFNNDLGDYLDNTVFPALPSELAAVVREVTLSSIEVKKIRLPLRRNFFNSNDTGNPDTEGLTWLWSDQSHRIRKQGINGSAITWWLGDSAQDSTGYNLFHQVDASGTIVSAPSGMGAASGITTPRGVVFLLDV